MRECVLKDQKASSGQRVIVDVAWKHTSRFKLVSNAGLAFSMVCRINLSCLSSRRSSVTAGSKERSSSVSAATAMLAALTTVNSQVKAGSAIDAH